MRRDGATTRAEEILVTNGAQQAIELVFRAFVERGDAVIIEEPTYTGALTVLGSLGARVVGVPVDEGGIRTDLLAVALERHRPRLLYVQPTFQNPSTRIMGEARRRELLNLARRHRCLVVEDDWAGDLRFEGEDLPSLYALDQGRHVIYLSTFSKKLMPGLRVGWLAAPHPALDRLVELKRIQDCGTSPLLQAALHAFLREGGLDEHLERVRPVYRERRDLMLEALQRHLPAEAHWIRPEGGLFVWVTMPQGFDGEDLFAAAQQRGVLFSRGELFHSDGSGRNNFRLTYSTASPSQIESGVKILGDLIRQRWPGRGESARRTATETMPIF
jgi:GntR family transcriptional regulator/MocR family aminotransferase